MRAAKGTRAQALISISACLAMAGCYAGVAPDADGSGTSGGVQPTDGSPEGTSDSSGGDDEDDGFDTASEECEDVELDPGETLTRRLTSWEYENTVSRVLGIDLGGEIEASWPAELHAAGFSNTANALIVSYAHVETFMALAQSASDQVNWPALLATHAACTEMSVDCQRGFVQSLGTALFRAPLTDELVDEYATPFAAAQAEGEGFEVGAALVLRSMLQSARFLYRLEDQATDAGSIREVTPTELASRLSYLVVGGPPDEALMAAAASDDLDEAGIRSEVARLLDTPGARAQSVRYVRDWLALDDLDETVRDVDHYPEFTAELIADMKRETTALAEHLLWEEQAPLMDLLTAQYSVMSDPLATFYGLTPTGEGESVYDLSGVPERRGILTHAGLLTHVGGAESNMVERGLFMLRHVLCAEVPPPPAGIDAAPVEVEPGRTRRDYSDERVDNASCGSCHRQFDPMAHAFERYDGLGRFSTQDEFGNPLRADSAFEVPGSDESLQWDTTREFIGALADTEAAQACMVRKPLQFAIGRPVDDSDADQCALADIRARFEEGGATYPALILGIATHPFFRLVRSE